MAASSAGSAPNHITPGHPHKLFLAPQWPSCRASSLPWPLAAVPFSQILQTHPGILTGFVLPFSFPEAAGWAVCPWCRAVVCGQCSGGGWNEGDRKDVISKKRWSLEWLADWVTLGQALRPVGTSALLLGSPGSPWSFSPDHSLAQLLHPPPGSARVAVGPSLRLSCGYIPITSRQQVLRVFGRKDWIIRWPVPHASCAMNRPGTPLFMFIRKKGGLDGMWE